MKPQIRKFLEISIVVAVFCIVGIAGSVEINRFTIKEGLIYSILAVLYMGIASLTCIFISVSEDKA